MSDDLSNIINGTVRSNFSLPTKIFPLLKLSIGEIPAYASKDDVRFVVKLFK